LLVQFVTPRRHQKRPVAVDFFLCAISSANVVQKRVKSEFRGIRPLTTNNLPVLRVHHCLLLVPGTWYLVPGTWYLVPGTAAAAAAAAGLADRGRTVLPTGTQQVFGIQVPGTLLVPGTRYRTPYVQDCCYCSGTVNHHSFRIVWSKN
jgi:hypothetical protein